MPSPIDVEVREQVVAAYLRGEGTYAEIAERFDISEPSVSRYLRLHRETQSVAPKPPRRGRNPTFNDEELQLLREHALAHPHDTILQLRDFMARQTGKQTGPSTIQRALRKLGIRRVRPPRASSTPDAEVPDETRYTARHRRVEPGHYPSSMTDAEWELLREHFEPARRGRGRPPEHSPRGLLDAIFYVLRAGCAWRMLPHDFPPYQTVYDAFRKWSRDGSLVRAHTALRRTFRRKQGRSDDPSALIIDSQSVKTTEKGGPEATTVARR